MELSRKEQERNIQRSADLCKAVSLIKIAKAYMESTILDLDPRYANKRTFKDWIRMLNRIEIDFNRLGGINVNERAEIMDLDITLQIDGILDMLMYLSPDERTNIEDYIENYVGDKIRAKKESYIK